MQSEHMVLAAGPEGISLFVLLGSCDDKELFEDFLEKSPQI
jgi:hypothetical protein